MVVWSGKLPHGGMVWEAAIWWYGQGSCNMVVWSGKLQHGGMVQEAATYGSRGTIELPPQNEFKACDFVYKLGLVEEKKKS